MKKNIKTWSTMVLLFALTYIIEACYVTPVTSGDIILVEKWSKQLPYKISTISKSHDDEIIFVKTSNSLYAINSEAGDEIWHVNIDSQLTLSSPLEYNGIVYICDSKGLHAFRVEDGKELWHNLLENNVCQVVDVSSDAVVVNMKSIEIRVYDAVTGMLLWSSPTGRGDVYAYITKDLVIVPDEGVAAFELDSGKVVWQIGNEIIGRSNSQNEKIYFSSGKFVYAFDTGSKTDLWKEHFQDNGFREIFTHSDVLLVFDTSYLYRLDATNGEKIWTTPLNGPSNPVIVADNIFVFENFSGKIQILELDTGNVVGYIKISVPKFSKVDNQKIVSVKDFLVFFEGNRIYSYH